MGGLRIHPDQVVVSCEHASNRVPSPLGGLGLSARALRQHVAWDIGALPLARECARVLGVPCHSGRWSRLVADLNRSVDHPKLMASETFGVVVPGNVDLPRVQREARVRRYWMPYRREVDEAILVAARRHGWCLHFSVHTFTPVAWGVVRQTDVGMLFDPSRRREAAVATAFARALRELDASLVLHRNRPYRGTSDGFTNHLRHVHSPTRYVGFELEVNQRLIGAAGGLRRMSRLVAAALGRLTTPSP